MYVSIHTPICTMHCNKDVHVIVITCILLRLQWCFTLSARFELVEQPGRFLHTVALRAQNHRYAQLRGAARSPESCGRAMRTACFPLASWCHRHIAMERFDPQRPSTCA